MFGSTLLKVAQVLLPCGVKLFMLRDVFAAIRCDVLVDILWAQCDVIFSVVLRVFH